TYALDQAGFIELIAGTNMGNGPDILLADQVDHLWRANNHDLAKGGNGQVGDFSLQFIVLQPLANDASKLDSLVAADLIFKETGRTGIGRDLQFDEITSIHGPFDLRYGSNFFIFVNKSCNHKISLKL